MERSRPALPALVVALLLSFTAPRAGHATTFMSVYAWPTSVAQGDSVGIFVSTDDPTVTIKVSRRGATVVDMAQYTSVPAQNQAVPSSVWSAGCGWRVTKRIAIPPDWPSGVYYVLVTGSTPPAGYAIFTVREDDPGSTAKILFQNSINTWQAYNAWGGKSLYDYSSTGGQRSYVVSFQRPYDLYTGRGDFPRWESNMVRWLESNGYAVEYCTNLDVHADPSLLSHYDLVLSVGHDEYWSWNQRKAFEDFIAAGGNVAFFSGNTCWWQVRVSFDLSKIICYKSKTLDPLYGHIDSLVTVNWYDDPVFRPENPLTGVSWRNGGYVDAEGWYPRSEGYSDYTVYRSGNWMYEGTGLADGVEFGWDDGIVGYEVDGALFYMIGGLPVVTGTDGTPPGYTITGLSIASQGHATMGYYVAPSGAIVFNAATTDWSDGLSGLDPAVMRITRNVIDRLAPHAASVGAGDPAGEGPPAGEAGAAALPRSLAAQPNPCMGATRLSFRGARSDRPDVLIHSVDGRLVGRLRAVAWARGSGDVVWNGLDRDGRAVPSGLYFATLADGGGAPPAVTRILVVR